MAERATLYSLMSLVSKTMLMSLAIETSGLSEFWAGVSFGRDWIEALFPFFGLPVSKEL